MYCQPVKAETLFQWNICCTETAASKPHKVQKTCLVFDPLWRKTDVKPGVSMGLAITKEIGDRLGVRLPI